MLQNAPYMFFKKKQNKTKQKDYKKKKEVSCSGEELNLRPLTCKSRNALSIAPQLALPASCS